MGAGFRDRDGSGLLGIMGDHNVFLEFIVFPVIGDIYALNKRLYRSFNSLLSFPASEPSGLTPIGMLFGCLFCFIRWIAFGKPSGDVIYS